ncbi:MAG: HEAT repeat domain-containing protein [Methanosarcina sp.]
MISEALGMKFCKLGIFLTAFILTVLQLIFIFQIILFSGNYIAGAASSAQDIEILIEDLNSPSIDIKVNSVKSLVEIGDPAVKPLIQALKSKDPDTRENAAINLGKIKDERAI